MVYHLETFLNVQSPWYFPGVIYNTARNGKVKKKEEGLDGNAKKFLGKCLLLERLRVFSLFPSRSERFQGGNGRSRFLRVFSEGTLREQPHLCRRPRPWENVPWAPHLEPARGFWAGPPAAWPGWLALLPGWGSLHCPQFIEEQ